MEDLNKITVSAPGKLLLMGEHAVVHGFPSIVTTVDKRISTTITKIETSIIEIIPSDSGTTIYQKPINLLGQGEIPGHVTFIEHALKNFYKMHYVKTGVRCEVTPDFSSTYGLGSSSAVTVSVLYALSKLFEKKLTEKQLFNLSYQTVLDVQGTGSGFDVAAAIWGGTLYFVKGGRTIEPVDAKGLELVVGYSGVKADTVALIAEVEKKMQKNPDKVKRIFEAIGKLVGQARDAISEHDWKRLGVYMNFNHEYLRDLGVSTEKLETLIKAAKDAGAYGAKLSGAGGGDNMIALVDAATRTSVEQAIVKAGGEVIPIHIHASGVRVETDDQNELFIVVDKDDNVLGYKTRRQCHADKNLIHRTIGVVVCNEQGQVLLQKRSSTKDMDPGLWCISCSGHVLKGQSYEDAAHRELVEELGVDMAITPVEKYVQKQADETEMAMLYRAVHNGPFTVHPQEVEKVEFFEPRRLPLLVASRKIILTQYSVASLSKVGIKL